MKMVGVARRCLLVCLVCAPMLAQARPVPWQTSHVHVAVEGKPVKDVLRDFAAAEGIPATIAKDVEGKVSGNFDMSPQAFLEALASSFGLTWYFDGSMLEITAAADVSTSTVKLQHASIDQLRGALTQLGIVDTRFPLQFDVNARTAIVSGTPHYVNLVTSVARYLDNQASLSAGTEIRIFKLHHAWAADHQVNIGDKSVTVAGVATVLQSMYAPVGSSLPPQTYASSSVQKVAPMADVSGATNGGSPLMPPLPPGFPSGYGGGSSWGSGPAPSQQSGAVPLLTMFGAAQGNRPTPPAVMPPGAVGRSDPPSDTLSPASPVIQADAATNSVLIRDVPERMDQYADLIEQLDVKPRLIEIEAHIIQIDEGALQQLGIDWRAHNSHVDLQTGTGATSQNGYTGTLSPQFGTTNIGTNSTAVAASPVGLSLTAVLGDAGRYLLARVDALAQTNQAKIDASPSVTTLDNVEAVMDAKQQMFIPVQGYTAGDLYSISTGVSLRVVPMVVEENGQTQIKLDVSIEDGAFSPTTSVNSIPIVQTSQIKTEAFVPEGQSLLIAGYRNDQNGNTMSGVPGLSKIPVIGALFRYRDHNRSHMEQLFLLSPRIIDL